MQNARVHQFVLAAAAGAMLLACGGNLQTSEPALAATAPAAATEEVAAISVDALHERLQSNGEKPLVVDVREPAEFEAVHIKGAQLAPLGTVERDLERVDRNREIVLVCRSGRRSAKAYHLLRERGFTNLRNLEGGMLAWEQREYPTVKP